MDLSDGKVSAVRAVYRRQIFLMVIASVVLLAIGLRVYSGFRSPERVEHTTWATPQAGLVDYVVTPWVAPDEAQAGPERIISLAPSNTEIACALGLRDRLIGRTAYCQYPPGIESIPSLGGLTDPNYEKIKSLDPDLILVTQNSYEVIRRLQALRLPFVEIVHESLDEVYTAIAQVGQVTGRPRTASALIGAIWTDIDRLRRAAGPHPETRVLLALTVPVPPREVFVAGPGTFLDTLLNLAGYVNAVRDLPHGKYEELPLEKIRELNPDIIVDFADPRTAAQVSELYASWTQVGELSAIRERRVVSIGPEWLSAGPRIAIGLQRLIEALGAIDQPRAAELGSQVNTRR